MRKNKTGGRKYFNQHIVIAPLKQDGTPNPKVGQHKTITHRLTLKN